jgi:CheY-like chemotaxis protein/PAS domain-containing protein
MQQLPRILVVGSGVNSQPLREALIGRCEALEADSGLETTSAEFVSRLIAGEFEAICVPTPTKHLEALAGALLLPESGGILSALPDGIAVLDLRLQIVWCNAAMDRLVGGLAVRGRSIQELFPGEFLPGADPSPFLTAGETRQSSRTQLDLGERGFVQLDVVPVGWSASGEVGHFVVVVRDITQETRRQRKLSAIFEAGLELGDMSAEDLRDMSVENRIDLLKAQIIHCTAGVLEYETVEIRLLERDSNRLIPLLNVGMLPEAAARELYALPEGNGVTGFVAAHGQSYLCKDSLHDPLYLAGAADARSSLTVPIRWNERTLGTFNVESRQPNAFSQQDLQFLELFGLEVAVAINRLDLLTAEKITTARESTGRIMNEVAQPVDAMLNDAVWILDKYIGHDPEVAQRLQQIIAKAREIKQKIQATGEQLTPEGTAELSRVRQRPRLHGKRVLVVDNDAAVRQRAHELLEPYGCSVETAHDGAEALLMVKNLSYDAVLADIRLPDMSGSECFRRVRAIRADIPIVLMTGFGYDPGHSIVKAREMGMRGALYKPFKQEMFLEEVEKAANNYSATIVNQGSSAGSTAADARLPG